MTLFYPDVSHYQAGLTIQPGTAAVCAKASEGSTFRDSSYGNFRAQATALGALFFGYHWLRRGAVEAQADFCHSITGKTPVMIDCEDTATVPTVSDCIAFASRIRALGGTCTLGYLPRWYWRDYLGSPSLSPLTANGLALVSSQFTGYSDTGPGWAPYGGVTPSIWQYTDSYPYGGYKVDFNAYRGTAAQLRTLVIGTGSVEEDDVTHLDLELGKAKVMTAPTVVGGAGFVCLSSDFGDALVRIALKHNGGGWEVHDNIKVTSTGDHVTAAKITSAISKISALLVSQTTSNTVVGLDVIPDHAF